VLQQFEFCPLSTKAVDNSVDQALRPMKSEPKATRDIELAKK
jgi:hypothetical protein